jgi:TetR/AcrR family transcriptional regulator, transcriptional repressor for nem operon
MNSAAEFGITDEALTAQVRGMLDRTEDAFQELLEGGRRAAEISATQDSKQLASLLLNTVTGMRLMGRGEPGPDRLIRVIDITIDLL